MDKSDLGLAGAGLVGRREYLLQKIKVTFLMWFSFSVEQQIRTFDEDSNMLLCKCLEPA